MTITIAPDRSERAAELAGRIVQKYGDEELSNDLLELLILVSDPDADAPRAAMKAVYSKSGLLDAAVDDYCRRVDARASEASSAGGHDGGSPLLSEPCRAEASAASDLQPAAR